MRGILLVLLATLVNARTFSDRGSRIERDTSEESFEQQLKEGNQLLRNEPNADDTMHFLEKLHSMENEIEDEFTKSSKPSADVLKELKEYGEMKRTDLRQHDGLSIEEVNTNSKVAPALFQGDIILTKEQADEILEDVEANEGSRSKRQAFRDKNYPKTIWPNGVYFAFYNASNDARRVFKKAAALWGWETCINFGETSSAKDKVLVMHGAGCWSHIGRIGGTQGLSLGAGCETVGVAAHELGHAIGLFHTQSRHDRDHFISIDFSNLQHAWRSQFVRQTPETNYNYNITYDYGSIMHYGATTSSINGQPFMWPRNDMKFLPSLGSPLLSFYDKLMVNLHYGCLEKCAKESSAKCENGGFPHPRDCSRCSCPSGYGGRLCNERPEGCGETLTATNEFQTLNDSVGRWDYHHTKEHDDFYMCNYWLTAPAGSTIEVVLDKYHENLALDGCAYAGVEIKTLPDKRQTGYRFCSPKYAGTRLVSTHNIVPIITYSRVYEANTVLRYRIASSSPESTSQPTVQPTPQPTAQPTSQETARPTRPSEKECNDPVLCTLLVKFGMCSSSLLEAEIKEMHCPGYCTTPTAQPTSQETLRPTSPSQKRCNDPILCTLLVKFGMCNSSSLDAEFREMHCAGSCTKSCTHGLSSQ